MAPSFPTNPDKTGNPLYSHINKSLQRLRPPRSERMDAAPPLPDSSASMRPPKQWFPKKPQRHPSFDLLRVFGAEPAKRGSQSSSDSFGCQTASPRASPLPPSPPPIPPQRPTRRTRTISSPAADSLAKAHRHVLAQRRAMPNIDTLAAVPAQWERNEPARLDVFHAPSRSGSPAYQTPPLSLSSGRTPSVSSRTLYMGAELASPPLGWPESATLRAYTQRCLLQDLGLRWGGLHKTATNLSPDQRHAADILLAGSWRAFVETLSPSLAQGGISRRDKETVYRETQTQMRLVGETYGMEPAAARELARTARELWAVLSPQPDPLSAEHDEPFQLANARPRVHFLRETKDVLLRISSSDRGLGPLRLTYLLGTALRLGEHLRSIDEVPERELACDDADFEALLTHLWRGPKTDQALRIYRAQCAALARERT